MAIHTGGAKDAHTCMLGRRWAAASEGPDVTLLGRADRRSRPPAASIAATASARPRRRGVAAVRHDRRARGRAPSRARRPRAGRAGYGRRPRRGRLRRLDVQALQIPRERRHRACERPLARRLDVHVAAREDEQADERDVAADAREVEAASRRSDAIARPRRCASSARASSTSPSPHAMSRFWSISRSGSCPRRAVAGAGQQETKSRRSIGDSLQKIWISDSVTPARSRGRHRAISRTRRAHHAGRRRARLRVLRRRRAVLRLELRAREAVRHGRRLLLPVGHVLRAPWLVGLCVNLAARV